MDKAIPNGWLSLLHVADPDIFYIYGEAALPTLETLHSRYAPTLVGQHVLRADLSGLSTISMTPDAEFRYSASGKAAIIFASADR